MLNRSDIRTKYAWLADDAPKNVVIGDDLDAAISALLYLQHNPQARIIGIYTGYNRLFLQRDFTWSDLQTAIFIDLDIAHDGCRSLGHHILRHSAADVLQNTKTACNLNELAGNRAVNQDFFRKYPLATAHFLYFLYDLPLPTNEFGLSLLHLADSTFINMQRYTYNISDWLTKIMPYPSLYASLKEANEPKTALNFERKIAALQQKMTEKGFNSGRGQSQSRELALTGFQCQPFGSENAAQMTIYIKNLLGFVAEILDFTLPLAQIEVADLQIFKGQRKAEKVNIALENTNLDAFLLENKVFSYVFPFKDSINYTVF